MKKFALGILVGLLVASVWWGRSNVFGAPSPPGVPASFAPFAGRWITHGGLLQVSQSGQGKISFRTYRNCTASVVTACDHFRGNAIYDGGFVTFTLGKVAGNKATGSVKDSSYSWAVFTPITITLNRRKDTVKVGNVIGFSVPFCGPKVTTPLCGA